MIIYLNCCLVYYSLMAPKDDSAIDVRIVKRWARGHHESMSVGYFGYDRLPKQTQVLILVARGFQTLDNIHSRYELYDLIDEDLGPHLAFVGERVTYVSWSPDIALYSSQSDREARAPRGDSSGELYSSLLDMLMTVGTPAVIVVDGLEALPLTERFNKIGMPYVCASLSGYLDY